MITLANALNDLWELIQSSENLKDKVRQLEKTMSKIVDQTIECVILIREYTGRGFFGLSHYFLPNTTIR